MTEISGNRFKVATQGGQVEVLKARLGDGKKLSAGELAAAAGLAVGAKLGS